MRFEVRPSYEEYRHRQALSGQVTVRMCPASLDPTSGQYNGWLEPLNKDSVDIIQHRRLLVVPTCLRSSVYAKAQRIGVAICRSSDIPYRTIFSVPENGIAEEGSKVRGITIENIIENYASSMRDLWESVLAVEVSRGLRH